MATVMLCSEDCQEEADFPAAIFFFISLIISTELSWTDIKTY